MEPLAFSAAAAASPGSSRRRVDEIADGELRLGPRKDVGSGVERHALNGIRTQAPIAGAVTQRVRLPPDGCHAWEPVQARPAHNDRETNGEEGDEMKKKAEFPEQIICNGGRDPGD
jgi:hypothetical protein